MNNNNINQNRFQPIINEAYKSFGEKHEEPVNITVSRNNQTHQNMDWDNEQEKLEEITEWDNNGEYDVEYEKRMELLDSFAKRHGINLAILPTDTFTTLIYAKESDLIDEQYIISVIGDIEFQKTEIPSQRLPIPIKNELKGEGEEKYKQILARVVTENPGTLDTLEMLLESYSPSERSKFYEELLKEDVSRNVIKQEESSNNINVISAKDALEPQPPIDWVIENLAVNGGLTMLVGKPGTYKSYSMLSLAVSVALGKPWLNIKTRKANVLIVDEESGDRRLRMRMVQTLHGLGGDSSTPVNALSLPQLDLRNPIDANKLRGYINTYQAELVIIDALADVMPNGDENSVKDVQPLFSNLRKVADECNCAIIIVHHTNKNNEYRGSTAIAASVDLLLKVEVKDNKIIYKSTKARDIEHIEFAASIQIDVDKVVMSPESVNSQKAKSTVKNLVIDFVKEHGPLSTQEIKDAIQMSTTYAVATIISTINNLAKVGLIVRINPDEKGRGVKAIYDIPNKASLADNNCTQRDSQTGKECLS